MTHATDELRTQALEKLITPHELSARLPLTPSISNTVLSQRQQVEQILSGKDSRLLVVIGPCSIHDPVASLEYANRLAALAQRYQDSLCVIMRCYFEKPRTIGGWKGLINDPTLDGRYQVNHGLALAREFLLNVNALNLGTATEFLDGVAGQYLADLISWGAIGARTTESQIHRQIASALSCPVGFKNGTDGNVDIAIDAVRAAALSHIFYSPDKDGQMTIYRTQGNPFGHVILRGGKQPNYHPSDIQAAADKLGAHELAPRLMVDLSHGNSQKQHKNQLKVAQSIAEQRRAGCAAIAGVMIESFIQEGKQASVANQPLNYGQSITDACLGWSDTETILALLAAGSNAKG